MIDIDAQLNTFLSQNFETEVLEFKEAKNSFDFDDLGKYFSALSNEANLKRHSEAWLIFGIKDKDKSIVGTQFRYDQAKLHSLKAEIANHTTNRITFKEIHEVMTDKGRVVMFQIPAAPQGIPVAWKGHYYGRDGEELHALNLEELERIRSQNADFDWSIQICEDATIADLSPEAINKARELYVIKNSKLADEIKSWDDVTFLNKAKITIKGKITNTAIVLLGKSESEYFLSPAIAQITWILKDKDNIEKDYEHFTCPLILNVDKVYEKIRNLKYRYIRQGSLFPDEVDSYDPYIIREALNNCIAHQDYTMGGKINLVEFEDRKLVFSNKGSFIPENINNVISLDAPEPKYRNKFLAQAMVSLNLIDTIGSGIKKMFIIQKNKFFPLPDYELSNKSVKVTIEGKVLDVKYASKLASMPELSLEEIILLDKVQKGHSLNAEEAKILKAKNLIEGKRPNLHISSNVAKHTNQEDEYIRLKGINDDYAKKMMIEYLKISKKAKKSDFVKAFLDKLPDVLSVEQKQNKIKNYLQELRLEGLIVNNGKYWEMAKN
jgi:ATP-dependent DNA helicase RecG